MKIQQYLNEVLVPGVSGTVADEEERQQAEAGRVSAEQSRVSAENERVLAEQEREESEENREQAETSRVIAETARQSAESARAQAESTRASQETQREQAESARNNAESARVLAENNRVSAETKRIQAEAEREQAEEERENKTSGIVAQATEQANRAEEAAAKGPKVTSGIWYTWDAASESYVSTGVSATGPQGPQGIQGPAGPQGAQGERGEAGPQGQVGPQGPTGPQGETGPRGIQGEQGVQGVQGPEGPQGPKGDPFTYDDFTEEQLQSLVGPQGDIGPQGPIGEQGPVGPQGEKGDVGYVFTPFVNDSGNLSWSNNGNLPNPETKNIRGPQGIQGIQGIQGPKGETGETGPQGPKGDTGTGLEIKGTYDTPEQLKQNVQSKKQGDMYNVGYSYPYTIYMWDETEEPYDWKPQGQLQGAKGDTGEQGPQGPRGYTYTPHMDSSGNLSWTNDGQQVNPDTVNLKGPQGEQGPQGQKGKDGAQGPKGDTGATGATGADGAPGEDGGYYTPSVDGSGNLTWTASKSGMPGISGANIKGPKGDTGADGQSAYEAAQAGGYTGSESQFNTDLAGVSSKQRVVDLGALTLSTHGSYENSAQLTEEQMDEIFSSDDPPVLLFVIVSSLTGYSFLVSYYDKENRFAYGKIDESEGTGRLKNSVCEIFPSQDGSFDGPLLSMQTFSYFRGIGEYGVLEADNQIKLPWDPTEPKEAATKQYVDNLVGTINTTLDTINGEVV